MPGATIDGIESMEGLLQAMGIHESTRFISGYSIQAARVALH